MAQIRELTTNKLKVKIYENRSEMGRGAANDVCERIQVLLTRQQFVNIIFAAAPSQNGKAFIQFKISGRFIGNIVPFLCQFIYPFFRLAQIE